MSDFPDRSIRMVCATLAAAAGALHLAQVGVHAEEDVLFAAFFIVVGILQLVGAAALVVLPAGSRAMRAVVRAGVVGSVLTIVMWALDRTLGLPFGSEPGQPETVGLADAAADLFELSTAFLLALWLVRPRALRAWLAAGAASAIVLALLWPVTRAVGLFDPDPRVTARPDLTDATAVAFLALTAVLCIGLGWLPRVPRSGLATTLAAFLLLETALVVFTLPVRAGQNRQCAYGSLQEDSQVSHAKVPPPVRLRVGETRRVVALIVRHCASARVALASIEQIEHGPTGDAGAVTAIALDDAPPDRRPGGLPAGHGRPFVGARLDPGASVAVVLEVQGRTPGTFYPSAFVIGYHGATEDSSTGFASYVWFCVGSAACDAPPTH